MTRSETKNLPFRTRPGLVARLTFVFTQAVTRRRDRQILSQLDDHILRDIGLTSDEAKAESLKPFWRA